jgi:hypothetical protein
VTSVLSTTAQHLTYISHSLFLPYTCTALLLLSLFISKRISRAEGHVPFASLPLQALSHQQHATLRYAFFS